MKPTPRVQEVGAYEAKTNLSRLLRQTRAGKSFIITQRGKPVAELKPAPVKRGKGQWGDMKGKIWIADDFCEPIEDMKEYME
ncbi:MAG: type II toxin-antitoxin system Phd/YefM family antitoxin [Chthoniobacterales bacterium]